MRNKYKTEQKKVLLDVLKKNCDKQLSIDQILLQIPSGVMGKSTVYRLIHNLTEEGVLKRFTHGNSQRAVYQLFDNDHCREHFHLKCTSCGKFIHLENKVSSNVLSSINRACEFNVDAGETIFLGKCSLCCKNKEI